jgi:hypothetical protein
MYRDDRLLAVAAGTVRRELAVLRHCLEIARNECGIGLPGNPLRQIELPPLAGVASVVPLRKSLRPF